MLMVVAVQLLDRHTFEQVHNLKVFMFSSLVLVLPGPLRGFWIHRAIQNAALEPCILPFAVFVKHSDSLCHLHSL